MNKKEILKQGFFDGLSTTWELTKVIVPIYFILTFLKYTSAIDWMVNLCEPLTSLVGLPGEAALPIVLANALTVYPAIPAIMAFPFTSKQITIIAIMILFCHSIPLESAIAKKSGANPFKVIGARIGLAIVSGVLLNILMGG